MSQNIFDIYTNNPITSNASTDLMYFGQSPYGATDDAAMTYANFSAQFALSSAIINAAHGGTGINNGTNTLTFAGNLNFAAAFSTVGNFAVTQTYTGITNVTFPTSGTLATTAQFTNWVAAPSTPITAVVNTGYYITDASQVTITLPTTAAAGSLVSIVGDGAGGWILAPGAGQTIKVINQSASTSIISSGQYDCIEVLCVVANTTWVARSLMSTGVTIV